MEEGKYYIVSVDPRQAPLNDHLMHGYAERRDFYEALRDLHRRWKDRVGECVGERNGFMRLRFHDTPGGIPDEEWLPGYLLEPAEKPDYLRDDGGDDASRELDRAFGFD